MHTYEARVIADQATGRPLAGVRVTVEDAETGAPVQPYRDGAPVQLVTGAHGLITEWQTEDTTRRVALTAGPVRLTQWCEEVMGDAQAAADRAEEAADRVGAPLITTEDVGFEGAVGDAEGRPSWLRYNAEGLPTPHVADALETVGVPHAEDAGDGLVIAGEDGTPTWLSATGEGGPDGHALTWLANALHCYVGPYEPEVHPGGWIVWTRTDATGTPIETLIGRN